jgi:hypothetical protein
MAPASPPRFRGSGRLVALLRPSRKLSRLHSCPSVVRNRSRRPNALPASEEPPKSLADWASLGASSTGTFIARLAAPSTAWGLHRTRTCLSFKQRRSSGMPMPTTFRWKQSSPMSAGINCWPATTP